jgi:UDP:flavonoid glycosyltransferase YjiC (YdhE family)
VTQNGVGLHLRPTAGADEIADAVRRLLDDDRLADRAATLGATVRADAVHSRALDHLEALAAPANTRR